MHTTEMKELQFTTGYCDVPLRMLCPQLRTMRASPRWCAMAPTFGQAVLTRVNKFARLQHRQVFCAESSISARINVLTSLKNRMQCSL